MGILPYLLLALVICLTLANTVGRPGHDRSKDEGSDDKQRNDPDFDNAPQNKDCTLPQSKPIQQRQYGKEREGYSEFPFPAFCCLHAFEPSHCGAQGRIRTFVVPKDGRFTVCCH